jgi:hypothetical protein
MAASSNRRPAPLPRTPSSTMNQRRWAIPAPRSFTSMASDPTIRPFRSHVHRCRPQLRDRPYGCSFCIDIARTRVLHSLLRCDLILDGRIESFDVIRVLKDPEPSASSRLGDGHLMKFFAFDCNARRRGRLFRGMGGHGGELVAHLSIPLILAPPSG